MKNVIWLGIIAAGAYLLWAVGSTTSQRNYLDNYFRRVNVNISIANALPSMTDDDISTMYKLVANYGSKGLDIPPSYNAWLLSLPAKYNISLS